MYMSDRRCWRCRFALRPSGPARLALCNVHLREEVRRAMGLSLYKRNVSEYTIGRTPSPE